ncbi:alpha/beta hydrolase [Streptomyces sp. H10-C2]|uniref:alpha/beta fold hydrolase n=1 Tax=unclassified Streptomyces TaxID=2593676 RepID=UPI0024B91E18|nr:MULTISPECIES: alpha/beta hydrolase [unclassified Streptomyces]MDJ0342374.1 alpha/beta hydrolase [Streptomyces sp. PH10-H1]MDJ0372229.1 alpha/beta hydrolase [Streptomyces sp. H10-C2]
MQLNTREWGTGDRTALLVHGIMSDHRTWRRVGPALADKGYRVIAVDLRGHGESPRGEYSPELFAEDLVDTLPDGAELAIGHSLGGLALSLAVERLAPGRAVYSDPAWASADPSQRVDPALFVQFAQATREQITAMNPRWEAADVEVELATLALWDTGTAAFLGGGPLTGYLPEKPAVPSLVQLAENSFLIGPADAGLLSERGFGIRTVMGASHTIHRDDFDGFLRSLDGWI